MHPKRIFPVIFGFLGRTVARIKMKKLFAKTRLMGSYFATRTDRLREIAAQRGLHHVDNAVSL